MVSTKGEQPKKRTDSSRVSGDPDVKQRLEEVGIIPTESHGTSDVAVLPFRFAEKFTANPELQENPAYQAWMNDVRMVWALPITPPEQLRWGRIEAYHTIPPGMRIPLPFTGTMGSSVADLQSEYAISVRVRGDEKAGFGGEEVDVPIMAATEPLNPRILDRYEIDTVVGKGGDKKLEKPTSLKEIMKRLGVETYEDVIHLFAFVPISNEAIRNPDQRYRTQFQFNLYLNEDRPTEFLLVQGSKVFDTALLLEGSGTLPFPNPVNRRLFEAVYSGDSADLIGVAPDSGTFVFIAKPIKGKPDFGKIITGGGPYAPDILSPTGDSLTMGGPMKGLRITEIGGVGVKDGDHSGFKYREAEQTVRDEERKPRVIMVTMLGVREGKEQALATAISRADERLLIPIQLRGNE